MAIVGKLQGLARELKRRSGVRVATMPSVCGEHELTAAITDCGRSGNGEHQEIHLSTRVNPQACTSTSDVVAYLGATSVAQVTRKL